MASFFSEVRSWADEQEDQKTAKEWIKTLLAKRNIDLVPENEQQFKKAFDRQIDPNKNLSLKNMESILSRLNSRGLVLDLQSNVHQGKGHKGVPESVLSRARKAFLSGNWDSFDFTENKITPKYIQARESERERENKKARQSNKSVEQVKQRNFLPSPSRIAPKFTGVSQPLFPQSQAPQQVSSNQIGKTFPAPPQRSEGIRLTQANRNPPNRQGLLEDSFRKVQSTGGFLPQRDEDTLPIASDDIWNQSLLYFDPILLKKRWDYD